MKTCAILDRQHTGKSAASADLGAWADLDGDGVKDVQEYESLITPRYLWHAEVCIRSAGHAVIPISDGTYTERHARAADYARQTPAQRFGYVAAHLNAGDGDYGSVFHDSRSATGRALAEAIAQALRDRCPELARVRVFASRRGDWTARAQTTIDGIWAGPGNLCGVVFEPCFINNTDHRPLLRGTGLQRIGMALADGIDAWAKL